MSTPPFDPSALAAELGRSYEDVAADYEAMRSVAAPPAADSKDWLPYCRSNGQPPAGTGGRKVWIRGRTGVPLPTWGHLADWRFVKDWCPR